VQNKCIGCTITLNRQIREYEATTGKDFTVDDIPRFSTKHEGICHKKSTYSSAGAEEYEGAKAGRALLFNKDGTPRDASTCVFIDTLVADNDTSGPKNMISTQHDTIGPSADNKGDHRPDLGHTVKGSSNDMFKLRETDKSFRGKNCLSNVRIKSIQSDITSVIRSYNPHVGNAERRDECLVQLRAIVRHHCNNHSCCKNENFCSNLKVRNEHPDWNEEQIQEEALKRSKRHQTYMDLTDEGIEVLEKIIIKRYNEKTIDKIAECGSSNKCEGFWSQLVKLSEGKRIAGCGTDLWKSMLELCYCMNGHNSGDVEKTRRDLSNLLNVYFTPIEERAAAITKCKRDKDRARHSSENGKRTRKRAKLTTAARTDKCPKSKRHKSGKVPIEKSCKKKTSSCTKCGQFGHQSRICVVVRDPPKAKKRHKTIRWDTIRSTKEYTPRAQEYRSTIFDWSKSSLVT
jgi:hypothetical protein